MTRFVPPATFNMADYFLTERLADGQGDRVALRLGCEERTYREVDALTNRMGHALARIGVRREQRVLLALPDGEAFAAALFAVLKLGAVVVMVNPAMPIEQLAAVIAYARASAAVVADDAADRFAGAAAGTMPLLRIEHAPDGRPDLDALPAGTDLPMTATHRDDPAIWLFTGGTTGRPKAVVQTHRSFANTTECYAKRAVGYGPDDITLSVPRLYFGYATGCNLLFPFAVGGSAALFDAHPTADVIFEQIRRHRPTILVNVPTMVQAMVDHPDAAEQDLSCLRFATSAGEALPPSVYARWKAAFGVELLDGLGTAEMWHIFLSNTPGAVRPGTLGRAVPGFDVRVRDEDGRDLPDGEVGRLWVRGDSRAIGYWQDLDMTARAFRGEWFAGGDMVRRDADGYFTYIGRADDALKVGGKWLLPAEVESCLLGHEAVAECAVVGVPDAAGLTKPVAFVVAPGASAMLEETLRAYALERLDAYKHPRRVLVVEELPRTHLGKVDRGALKRLATTRPGR